MTELEFDPLRSTMAIQEKRISEALKALGYPHPIDGVTNIITALTMIADALEDVLSQYEGLVDGAKPDPGKMA